MFWKTPTIINLWVGSVDEYLGIESKKIYPDSVMCDVNLYYKIVKESSTVNSVYAAIGDIDVDQMRELMTWSKNIYYIPPFQWNDQQSAIQTIELLNIFKEKIKTGLEHINQPRLIDTQLNSLQAQRVSDDSTLFVIGCSVAKGVGVSTKETFATHLQTQLNMPLVVLAESATSISWAADQILRSDIRKDDVVVWAVTGLLRTWWFEIEQTPVDQSLHTYHYNMFTINQSTNLKHAKLLKKYFVHGDKHLLVQAIRQIQQVENFCNKIGAKLYFSFLPLSNRENLSVLNRVFSKNTNHVTIQYKYPERWLDLGTDGLHPGPITHRYIADSFLKSIPPSTI